MQRGKNEKMAKRGRGLGHVIYFSNFGTPLISLELLKIQTSNFARRLMARYAKPEKWKLGQRGRALGHVTYFLNFGTPNISGKA